ncbi:hypothetical protein [Lentzea sp.]
MSNVGDHLAAYEPPEGTGITLEEATAAVREARERGDDGNSGGVLPR